VLANDSQLVNTCEEQKAATQLKFRHHLANLTTTLAATAAGLFVGAVVTYFGGLAVYLLFYKAGVVGSVSCGGGSALTLLLLLVGANIGSTCGGIFGFANRIYKPAAGH
jgi:hypothetical protein